MTLNEETSLSLRQFVLTYIIPLFFSALVLVGLSYFNELREQQSQQQIEEINQALSERDDRISELESRVAVLEDTIKDR